MISSMYFIWISRMATVARSRSLLFAVMFAVTVAADDGDDFANNLFSDLAPLLALFGERVTMQFMSQSLGWADSIILAMAPLGIITIITSAIRVGGPSFLKALIGRARENLAVAEQELMSSTSKEVCELWNGHEVVRCMGSSPVTEFICLLPTPQVEHGKNVSDPAIRQSQHAGPDHSPKITVMDLEDILGKQFIKIDKMHTKDYLCGLEDGSNSTESSSPEIIITRNQHLDAPNISLNSHSQTNRVELRIVAVLGTILQLGVLTFSAYSVYHPVFSIGFQRDGNPVAAYAFPCHAAGTLILVIGMLLCAHVVESSTSEETFRPGSSLTAQLVWLQQAKTVNDQMFDSFAIYANSERTIITTSRRRGNQKTIQNKSDKPYSKLSDPLVSRQPEATQESAGDIAQPPPNYGHSDDSGTPSPKGEVKPVLELETSLGTFIGLCGFIVQFVGLRGLHWSTSIAQLGAVLLMAGLKAWVRRGLADPPRCQHVLPGFELDWFATTFADVEHAPWKPAVYPKRWTLERLRSIQTRLVRHNKPQTNDQPAGKVKDSQIWTLGRLEATQEGLKKLQTGEQPGSGADLADRMVKIRRDLAQLASWHGPASVEAVAIARSIEATMDFFFPVKEESTEILNYTWALKTPTQGQVHFRLRRENGKWQAYADEIEAALSLWLFSVAKEENDDRKDRPDKLLIGDAKDDKWLRAKGVTAKNSLRILGSHIPSLHRDLSWWIPHETTRIISLTKTEGTANPTQILSVRNHRIVGPGESSQSLGKSTKFKVQELLELRFDSNDHRKPKDCDSKDGQDGNGNSSATQRKDDCEQNLLAVEFIGPLRSLFAQDIFSSFFMAAAKSLNGSEQFQLAHADAPHGADHSPFTEPAQIQHNGTSSSQAWQSFTLRSDQLTKLARTIQSTGLGSLDDIYLSMIPSLSAENKLPQATRVIDLTRQHAEPHEKLQRWDEASDAYLWLLRVAKTFTEDSEFVAQAVAILVEFLRQVNSALDLCETLEDERRKTLAPLKRKIESELCSSDKIQKIFDRLLILYTAQQRPWNKEENNNNKLEYEFPGTFNLTDLHNSLTMFDYYSLHEIIEKDKTNLNTKDVLGWTPLNYAVQQQMEIDFVFRKVKSELAVTYQDLLGHTPLHYACGTKHEYESAESSIRTLLQWGAEINAQGRDGVAPIHCAAKSGNLQATRFLVESGANIDIQDASGKTPLLWSMVGGNQATVEYLWENANRKLRDGEGRTALHLAVVFADDKTVEWLLDHGADARAVDRSTRTPLHQIVQTGRVGSEVMSLLCKSLLCKKYGADVNAKDNLDRTALHWAAKNGHEAVVEWLVQEAGANVNAKDNLDRTALHWAAENSHEAVVEWLVQEAGADMNAKENRQNRTPLHLAAENGHEAVVEWLVQEAGADMNAKENVLNRTPLHLAAENGHEAVVEWLVKKGGADMNAEANSFMTPLHCAAENGHEAVVEWLVQEAGADMNAEAYWDRTALHLAAKNGHKAVVEWLVKKAGADVNAKDGFDWTPLHCAAENGHEAVVEWLVQEAGANVNAKACWDHTALQRAANNGHKAVVEWLVKKGGAVEEALEAV